MVRHPWSLRWLIGGIYFFIMATLFGVLVLYFSYSTTQDYMSTIAKNWRKQAGFGADIVKLNLGLYEEAKRKHSAAGIASVSKEINRQLRTIKFMAEARRVTIIDLNGTPIFSTIPISDAEKEFAIWPSVVQQVLGGHSIGEDIQYNPSTSEELLFIAVPVKAGRSAGGSTMEDWPLGTPQPIQPGVHSKGKTLAFLVMAIPTGDVKNWIKGTNSFFGLAFLAAMLVLFLINAATSSFLSRPLKTLSDVAERYAQGHLAERVVPSGAAEVASLGSSFNRMAEQLRGVIGRLAEERAQAEAMLTSMVDGVIVTDTQGTIILINRSAEQLFDITDVAVGRTLPEVIFHYELQELLLKTLATGLPHKQEISFTLPVEQVLEAHVAPVAVEGRERGAVLVCYDITPQRQLERVQRDFVANVSHELRTPVASIRAMAETLFEAGNEEPEMTADFLSTIISESERLSALLDDLLQIAHIESGRHTLNLERFDLSEVIRHTTERVMAPITAKNQHLVLTLPKHLPVVADRAILVQVLVNLIDNARKYSPEGSTITISARSGKAIHFQVADTGMGIPLAEQERIFERFYRIDKARSRAQGGTGLGLAIVRHLVELHGGTITVASTVGVGSTFSVEIPISTLDENTPEEAGEPPSGSQRPARADRQPAG